jgi:hypothetical protein
MGRKRMRPVAKGPIAEVLEKRFGGNVRRMSVVADTSTEAIYKASARGHFAAGAPAMNLARYLYPRSPARQLAEARRLLGLEP